MIYLVPAVVAILLFGAGCTPQEIPMPVNNQPPSANAPVNAAVPTSDANPVSITNFSFSPSSLTVKRGQTVVWTNNDGAAHTVTVDAGTGPASGTLSNGATYSYTFNAAGTFNYHCAFHASMRGTVIVTP